jgi:hypothetical protein
MIVTLATSRMTARRTMVALALAATIAAGGVARAAASS